MAKAKDVPRFWLVCTTHRVLFTVPLSIISKKFRPERYADIFEGMASVLHASNPWGDPTDFDMFRYDPVLQRFAVKRRSLGIVAAYFLEDRPWIDFNREPLDLKNFLRHDLGVPLSLLDSAEIYRRATIVGSKEVKVPSAR